ncbi:MAG TPA: hypothetical protein VNE39_29000, partial [Planctomycetota bacterium]|nr:hypothetical protein [Planctomycetota bacterium]
AVIYRTMGSLGFVAASRAVWAVGQDRREPGRMLLLPVKCNLAGGVTGLAYRIVGSAGDASVPVLAWEPEAVTATAEEAFGVTRRAPTLCEQAQAWIAGLLCRGPLLAQEVEERARGAGFSSETLRRARRALGVVAYHKGFGSPWVWGLPGAQGAATASAPDPAVNTAGEAECEPVGAHCGSTP